NGWGDTWRDGIYDYLHYHSRIHEVLGIARGSGIVRLGGNKGRIVKLKAGDAVMIPAGTGHQCLSASKTFMAVGAYPPTGTYDECGPTAEEHVRNVKAARKGVHARTPFSGATVRFLKPGSQTARCERHGRRVMQRTSQRNERLTHDRFRVDRGLRAMPPEATVMLWSRMDDPQHRGVERIE